MDNYLLLVFLLSLGALIGFLGLAILVGLLLCNQD